jgi:hypothetical protein
MAVVWIWQGEAFNESFVAGHKAVWKFGIHTLPSPFQLCSVQILISFKSSFDPFGMNLLCPFDSEQSGRSDPKQQTADEGRK